MPAQRQHAANTPPAPFHHHDSTMSAPCRRRASTHAGTIPAACRHRAGTLPTSCRFVGLRESMGHGKDVIDVGRWTLGQSSPADPNRNRHWQTKRAPSCHDGQLTVNKYIDLAIVLHITQLIKYSNTFSIRISATSADGMFDEAVPAQQVSVMIPQNQPTTQVSQWEQFICRFLELAAPEVDTIVNRELQRLWEIGAVDQGSDARDDTLRHHADTGHDKDQRQTRKQIGSRL
ncbi:hypothetical protein QBC47DRAFT_357998 [Echria macrotheca]|uniref:Uncharacterized protein n=1 Tax=Echria macrotheca TaxID=438768 RepID=A0AAJ0BH06_9PEZI|nr:hypothetical protein QBC47DRAFT_357998 [Echria macrotheca]